MKYLKFLPILIIAIILYIPKVSATNNVDIYFFYNSECPHCADEEVVLAKLKTEYSNLILHSYEVGHNEHNMSIYQNVASFLDVNIQGVPCTIIGKDAYFGFDSNNTETILRDKIEYFSTNEYINYVGEFLDGKRTSLDTKTKTKDDDVKNYVVSLPLIGEVELQNLSIPIIAIVLGALDGFNPCATWVLLFLISMLLGMENKRRQWALGLTFLITSAVVYMLFMLAWLNFTTLIGTINWLRWLIATIAIIGGIVNLKSFYDSYFDDGCTVVNDTKRKRIFDSIKHITREKSFFLAFFGVAFLAASVNIIELACSAGFPVVFTSILTMNEVSSFGSFMYVLLYILFFLLDDIIIFAIAMFTLEVTGVSTKYGKITKIVGGLLMILIGLLLILKPEWLAFQF